MAQTSLLEISVKVAEIIDTRMAPGNLRYRVATNPSVAYQLGDLY